MTTLAGYEGADRAQKLLEGARKEGVLTLYSSATQDDIGAIIRAFEKAYGIRVKFWRGDTDGILQRIVTEARGGRNDFDVAETGGGTLETLYREKLLIPVRSPILDDISPKAKPPHGAWVGTRFQLQTLAFNTNVLRKSDLPKVWSDLADPKWKGKLATETENADWFGQIVTYLGEEPGLKLMREIARRNGVAVRKGHSLLAQLTASGEVPLALGVYTYRVTQLKKAGAPIDMLDLDPVVAHPVGIGLSKLAPHPFSAALFFDFILTDGQRIYAAMDNFATDTNIMPEPPQTVFIDYSKALDERPRWSKLLRESFTGMR